MAVTIEVDREFGWVVVDIFLLGMAIFWQMSRVGAARRKYGVKYPTMYSDKSEVFNCVQRVHQNTLEMFPQFVTFLLLGSLQHPRICAIAGFVFTVGRVVYALGYYTGDPKKRLPGSVASFVSLFVCMFCTISFGLHVLGFL